MPRCDLTFQADGGCTMTKNSVEHTSNRSNSRKDDSYHIVLVVLVYLAAVYFFGRMQLPGAGIGSCNNPIL